MVEVDASGAPASLQEKPRQPKSNLAVAGLYFYDSQATALAQSLKPSSRGELEITDLNELYLNQGQLKIEHLGRGYCWMDTGTHDRIAEASQFVRSIEHRQGLHIGCPEEIALRNGWLDQSQLLQRGLKLQQTPYGQYLISIAKQHSPILDK